MGVRRDIGPAFPERDGMVACNPRDREAAHRAEMEGSLPIIHKP